MEERFQKICDYLNENDRFAKVNNMRITEIREGHAEGIFDVGPDHRNGLGVVQGGALYTFGDFIFAGAVNSYGTKAIGMNSNITYLRPGLGSRFRATADVIHKGRQTGVFNVQIMDEKDKLVCQLTLTGFYLKEPFFESECGDNSQKDSK